MLLHEKINEIVRGIEFKDNKVVMMGAVRFLLNSAKLSGHKVKASDKKDANGFYLYQGGQNCMNFACSVYQSERDRIVIYPYTVDRNRQHTYLNACWTIWSVADAKVFVANMISLHTIRAARPRP